jgi:hypothetical protein
MELLCRFTKYTVKIVNLTICILYMDDHSKKINIIGTNNKYKMKQLANAGQEKEVKKRVSTDNWNFDVQHYTYANQMKMIIDISNNHLHSLDNVSKIAIQEINKKISSYKQQDKLKKKVCVEEFITFESIIHKMIECELKCRYCNSEMTVLYDISREMKQWSVDRVDNDKGHNINNYHLACLECNLKRRRRTDEKFLFTKQLNIIKQD